MANPVIQFGIVIVSTLLSFFGILLVLHWKISKEKTQRNEVAIELGRPINHSLNTTNNTLPSHSKSLPWTFPITVDKLGKVSSTGESRICFLTASDLQANYDLPKDKKTSYFEVKILSLDVNSNLYIGLATRNNNQKITTNNENYLSTFFNGFFIESKQGNIISDSKPVDWISGNPINEGDFIGCLISHSSPPHIIFSHNGKEMKPVFLPLAYSNLAPTIYCIGQSQIEFNFGEREFLFTQANRYKWGLVNTSTLPDLPPHYPDLPN